MNRRKFLRNAGLLGAGTVIAPYILPSGRLFAASGEQKAKHVLFVMFGGGVRQQESILQRYLEDSQPQADGTNPGNIMYNMFEGAPPTQKIIYGNNGVLPGDTPIPKILSTTLERMGTTFREVRAMQRGHYAGYVSMIQGQSALGQGLRQKPVFPTLFEYVRRHMGAPASKVWFIGENIGNSIPLLNYGLNPNYGIKYGANFFAPPVTFGNPGKNSFFGGNIYHPDEEMQYIYKMKYFLDNYYRNLGGVLDRLGNTEQEKFQIKKFMERMYQNSLAGDEVSCAIEVMREFKPTLTVMNFNAGVDSCHGNFTTYLKELHKSDHKVARLWQAIETIPEMAGQTALVICPEHGRNLNPNPVLDENDLRGFDHSDANTDRIFAQMVGPNIPANVSIGNESNPVGTNADCVLTIADILGIKNEVRNAGFVPGTQSFFDQM
ncbi:MAG TPA: hypothetical protein VFV37_09470 [Luteibaculaceae bacterium]|nr:hypothetical protein [Luteibaculaceae bacterium]